VDAEEGCRSVILAIMAAASQRKHSVFPEHVLFGLATSNDRITGEALKLLGVTRDRVAALIDHQSSFLEGPRPFPEVGPLITPRAARLLVSMEEEATGLGHPKLLPAHLLLALTRDDLSPGVLDALHVDRSKMRGELLRRLATEPMAGD